MSSATNTADRDGGGKPRGMAVAKANARESAARGARPWDCPYKHKAWRSVWLKELENAQQMSLLK